MIKVTISPEKMQIEGHAGSGAYGHDIVCAAVSALVQTFTRAVDILTDDNLETVVNAETGQINTIVWGVPSKETKLLIDAMWLGLFSIARDYPDNLKAEIGS